MTYRDVFPRRFTLLPVIHIRDVAQAVAQARLAQDCGADGAWLINGDPVATALEVRRACPGLWLGVNRLERHAEAAFDDLPACVGGVWTDDAGYEERTPPDARLRRIDGHRARSGFGGLHFGGVAFKGQEPVQDPARAAAVCAAHLDAVTTSGPGTAQAADPAKIAAMKRALGPAPLAIASGITPENVHLYGDADCFLVASGISKDWHRFDEAKLRALVQRLRALSAEQ